MKFKLLKGFLIGHLVVVLLGSGLIKQQHQVIDRILLHYASWTGGGFGYSFFSPNVGNQTVVKTYTLTAEGQLRQDALGAGKSLFDSRFSAMIHVFRNQKAFELIARITASYMFARYPGCQSTYVCIGEFRPPSMVGYRRGDQSQFREIYNGIYTLN